MLEGCKTKSKKSTTVSTDDDTKKSDETNKRKKLFQPRINPQKVSQELYEKKVSRPIIAGMCFLFSTGTGSFTFL